MADHPLLSVLAGVQAAKSSLLLSPALLPYPGIVHRLNKLLTRAEDAIIKEAELIAHHKPASPESEE